MSTRTVTNSPTAPPPPAVGQVWRDMDPREQNPSRHVKIVAIGETHANCVNCNSLGRTIQTPRKVRIRLDRFKGSARSGWMLAINADGTTP